MRRRAVAEILGLLVVALCVGALVGRRRRSEPFSRITSTPRSPQSPPSGNDRSSPEDFTVALVGDSIIHMSASEISDALQGTYRLTVRAHPGAKLDDIEALTDSLLHPNLGRVPDAMVVTLGTNDVTGRTAEWNDHWATLMHRIASVPRVILFTINRHADELGKRHLDGPSAGDINDAMARVNEATNVFVVDWDAAVQADVELVWDRREHRGDFVHPSAKGQRWIAEQIRAALAESSHALG
jgi:hypothetical protein